TGTWYKSNTCRPGAPRSAKCPQLTIQCRPKLVWLLLVFVLFEIRWLSSPPTSFLHGLCEMTTEPASNKPESADAEISAPTAAGRRGSVVDWLRFFLAVAISIF